MLLLIIMKMKNSMCEDAFTVHGTFVTLSYFCLATTMNMKHELKLFPLTLPQSHTTTSAAVE